MNHSQSWLDGRSKCRSCLHVGADVCFSLLWIQPRRTKVAWRMFHACLCDNTAGHPRSEVGRRTEAQWHCANKHSGAVEQDPP